MEIDWHYNTSGRSRYRVSVGYMYFQVMDRGSWSDIGKVKEPVVFDDVAKIAMKQWRQS